MKILKFPKKEGESIAKRIEGILPELEDSTWLLIIHDTPDGPMVRWAGGLTVSDVIAQCVAVAVGMVMIPPE